MSDPDAVERRFEEAFAARLGGGACISVAKGRVALFAGLKALGLPPGAEILMPGYTCVVVPAAAMFAGFVPVYADIDPLTCNLDPARLDAAAGPRTAALIVQHSYGIPADMAALSRWAEARGIPMIEDCCHTFGSTYDGQPCGSFGRFAFFSGQWSKFFSTGLGGFLYTRDAALAQRARTIVEAEAARPSRVQGLRHAAQIRAYRWLVRPSTTAAIKRVYRTLSGWGLAAGSSTAEELRGELPPGYFARMTRAQLGRGLAELARIEVNRDHRRHCAEFYRERLPGLGFATPPADARADTVFLRYPVRCANKAEVVRAAEAAGIEIGSWFDTPLHDNAAPLSAFGYRDGTCPAAEQACREVINLPTHTAVDLAYAARVLAFLREKARPVRP